MKRWQKLLMERKHYIDNLRLICILLLFPYHAAMAYNCWGEGNYVLLHANSWISSFVVLVSPWYMTLLFVLAGMSTKYSLERRSSGQYLQERCRKLLLPLLAGTLLIMPVLTYCADYYNCGYAGNFFSHYMVFFCKWTDLTGYDGGFTIGHLWFLLYLFVISTLSMIVILLQKKYLPKLNERKIRPLATAILVMTAMLFLPVKAGGKIIVTYFLLYLIGYYILSVEDNITGLQKQKYLYLSVFVISSAANVYLFLWSGRDYGFINQLLMYLSGASGILTLICFGRSLLNKTNRIIQLLVQDSFLIYIFHFLWVVLFEILLDSIIKNDSIVLCVSVIAAFAVTVLTCQIIRRIPFVCSLFGNADSRRR